MPKVIHFFLGSSLLFFLTGCGVNERDFKSSVPVGRPALEERVIQNNQPSEQPETEVPSPRAINLDVPFYAQAPEADWSLPWQEACEEASIILAYHALFDQPLSKEQFKDQVLSLVEWQKKHFGDYRHTTVGQTADMLTGYFDYSDFKILESPSVDDIKKELSRGHVLVAPFAGRLLGNPFYSGTGPYYHMLVIKGYDEKNFITNDVGTRRGENFIYPYDTLMNALHDYHDTDMRLGSKKVIVLY